MIATLESLLVLAAILIGLLVYKLLVHSHWFARFIASVVETPAAGMETVDRLKADRDHATQAAAEADQQAAQSAQTAQAIRAELPPVRKPRAPRKKSEKKIEKP